MFFSEHSFFKNPETRIRKSWTRTAGIQQSNKLVLTYIWRYLCCWLKTTTTTNQAARRRRRRISSCRGQVIHHEGRGSAYLGPYSLRLEDNLLSYLGVGESTLDWLIFSHLCAYLGPYSLRLEDNFIVLSGCGRINSGLALSGMVDEKPCCYAKGNR